MNTLITTLRSLCGDANVFTHDDPGADLSTWEQDWRKRWRGKAGAVVRPASAEQVAADALRWLSWSPRVLEVQVTDLARFGPQGTDDLYAGRRVVLTSEQHGITAQAAVIGEREWDAEIALVRVYLLDDPLTAV